jgi:hypothetical protein
MLKLEILNHWIIPQQAKNPSGIDEEPVFSGVMMSFVVLVTLVVVIRRPGAAAE